MKQKRKLKWRSIIYLVVMASLAFSIVYAVVKLFTAPMEPPAGGEHVMLKSDYLLMLGKCVMGVVVLLLPDLLNRRVSFDLPNYMFILYYIFLFCAIYLGEVQSFYTLIPHWDSILHAFSGVMLGALGFALVTAMNDSENVLVHLSPGFVALFAFCFALACGAVWEIYEYVGDGVLGLNMQRHSDAAGVPLPGREALLDTMKDIIIDAAGALVVTIVGDISLRRRAKALPREKSAE